MTEARKVTVILVADIAAFSRLAGAEEERTLAGLRALRSDLIDPTNALHGGRLVKRTGDGAVVEFRSVVEAVQAAIEVQTGMPSATRGFPQTSVLRPASESIWATWSRKPTAISSAMR